MRKEVRTDVTDQGVLGLVRSCRLRKGPYGYPHLQHEIGSAMLKTRLVDVDDNLKGAALCRLATCSIACLAGWENIL